MEQFRQHILNEMKILLMSLQGAMSVDSDCEKELQERCLSQLASCLQCVSVHVRNPQGLSAFYFFMSSPDRHHCCTIFL